MAQSRLYQLRRARRASSRTVRSWKTATSCRRSATTPASNSPTTTSAASTTCRRQSGCRNTIARDPMRVSQFGVRRRRDVPHDGEHQRGPDRDRAGLSERRSDDGDRRYFEYEMDAPIWPFVSFQSARYAVSERSLERRRAAGVLPPAARLQRGADDRRVEEVAGLLHARILAVSVQAVPHPGIPGVRNVRAVVSEHDSVLRRYRLHREPDRRQDTSTTSSTSPRTSSRTSGGDTRSRAPRARHDDSRRDAGAVFGA